MATEKPYAFPIPADVPTDPTERALWFAQSLCDSIRFIRIEAERGKGDGPAEDYLREGIRTLVNRLSRDVIELDSAMTVAADDKTSVHDKLSSLHGIAVVRAGTFSGTSYADVALGAGIALVTRIEFAASLDDVIQRILKGGAGTLAQPDPDAVIQHWNEVRKEIQEVAIPDLDELESGLRKEKVAVLADPPNGTAAREQPKSRAGRPANGKPSIKDTVETEDEACWVIQPGQSAYRGTRIDVRNTAFSFLKVAVENNGIATKEKLLKEIWGDDAENILEESLKNHAFRLRKALRAALNLAGGYDPFPCIGRGKNLAWRLAPEPYKEFSKKRKKNRHETRTKR